MHRSRGLPSCSVSGCMRYTASSRISVTAKRTVESEQDVERLAVVPNVILFRDGVRSFLRGLFAAHLAHVSELLPNDQAFARCVSGFTSYFQASVIASVVLDSSGVNHSHRTTGPAWLKLTHLQHLAVKADCPTTACVNTFPTWRTPAPVGDYI
jgi:hypothetical protein